MGSIKNREKIHIQHPYIHDSCLLGVELLWKYISQSLF